MINIHRLFKTFQQGKQRVSVFEDFDLEIRHNELVVLFGPSGCGKSTLLNMIARTEPYDAGMIKWAAPQARIGFISQYNSLLPWLSVIDNVAFGLKLQGVSESTRLRSAYELLEEMDLVRYADFYPHQLSGGLSQLIAFARAVACQSEVLLMDEPFSSIDFVVRNKLQDTILDIHKKRKLTTVFVTHQIDEALYVADRIVVLADSKPTHIVSEFDTRGINDKNSQSFFDMQRRLLKCY